MHTDPWYRLVEAMNGPECAAQNLLTEAIDAIRRADASPEAKDIAEQRVRHSFENAGYVDEARTVVRGVLSHLGHWTFAIRRPFPFVHRVPVAELRKLVRVPGVAGEPTRT
jgi:hypothetical protein